MTDSSGWWGDWRLVLAAVLAVLSAGVVTLVVRDVDPATADTVVSTAVDAEVVVNGRRVVATDGMLVPPGASVQTGEAGSATLETADREVYLGPGTAVAVVDGVQQSLERGLVMVDGRNGAPLSLTTPAGTVAIERDALARVENEVSLRLAVFEGAARMTALGRRATTDVSALHQLRTPYGGLPGSPTALALKGDRWEQLLVADLVAADTDLNNLARGLENAKGVTVVNAVSSPVRTYLQQTQSTPGEKALAAAVAEAAPGNDVAGVYTARREGGSWGVVAALVEARVSDVSAVLDRILEPATAPPLVAVPQPPLDGLLTPAPGTTGGSSRDPGSRANGSGGPHPTRTRTPSPTPSPSTTPSPTTAVEDVVTTVQTLISPSPGASARRGGILPFP